MQSVLILVKMYDGWVPRLWSETIAAHRREVGDAILDTTAALVSRHGLRAVTMSQIAEETGIGRATLYKYYRDVEAILVAWHERLLSGHLEQLATLRGQPGDPLERLETVLGTYALIRQEHHGTELEALLHRDEHLAHAQRHLSELIRELIIECVKAGEVRKDVPPEELATYCLHALGAAGSLRSRTAVQRLVRVTLDGLHPSG
jgi:AcrR family transcriptional regulator